MHVFGATPPVIKFSKTDKRLAPSRTSSAAGNVLRLLEFSAAAAERIMHARVHETRASTLAVKLIAAVSSLSWVRVNLSIKITNCSSVGGSLSNLVRPLLVNHLDSKKLSKPGLYMLENMIFISSMV